MNTSAYTPPGWNSYTQVMANIKSEPQAYGHYGCQYPSATPSPAADFTDDPLQGDLKDIKLEDLCYLADTFPADKSRSSVSPSSFCSTDYECGGSPTSDWPDQMVPPSPQTYVYPDMYADQRKMNEPGQQFYPSYPQGTSDRSVNYSKT